MANYIRDLQHDREALRKAIDEAREHLGDLYAYLYSPKFSHDTTVQVNDVILRLGSVRDALIGADYIYRPKCPVCGQDSGFHIGH